MFRRCVRAPRVSPCARQGDPGDPTTTCGEQARVDARNSPIGQPRPPRAALGGGTDTGRTRSPAVPYGPSHAQEALLPFTLSHAAAVLPAVRRDGGGRARLVPAVLVAGSCAPDLPYYAADVLPGGMESGSVTHAFAGVVTVDALLAWALAGLWLQVREPLLA
ncbi:DUF4184 family protein, partial [Streptomyces sp. WELS2]|uniref:DUF4184 family protein n=1 Tax=Streptomyces sp. WELS2 TaxID=2749435 RepID=UPI00215DB20E